ncbi:putative 2'-deoxynucleoside 5'-phosphate N-hydrolase 1 [Nematostella vectensis]|uniref:putative 2'-deoxynucleoside 5'-phosphate N-hydrolase 1 n=1 Tax=Nematostella vectensis TaxID=45351 RepID=UPI0020771C6E|nr:putative 2'-deoxynucleoside 5'-phosphate N-hydrolase 1 [Nematostella vectensis]
MSSKVTRKIYFCGSIRGGREDTTLYKRIIDQLKSYGEVLTEHVGDLEAQEEELGDDYYIHERDINWLFSSDAVVAEVTQPSLGVGYELGRALEHKKNVLCLYRPQPGKRLSAMIKGAENGKNFFVKEYKEEDVPDLLKNFFTSL